MAVTVRELLIELATKVDDKELLDLDQTLDKKVPQSAKKAQGGLDGFFSAVKKGGAIVAGATVALIGFAVETSKNFETLRTSLKTVTGSAENADKAFKFITEFASTTPFQVTEIADAFIKLTALGLEPSERALQSYGNTASAMGKSLDQFIEAVADATTGEFERLKEFGIKTRVEGDRIKLTFQGVTTNIGNNADEIQEFLQGIGEVQFAGAMENQMNTLAGAFSNIQDNVQLFLFQLGEEGLLDAAKEVAGQIRDLTGDSEGLAKKLGPALSTIITSMAKLLPIVVDVIEETAFLINNFDELTDQIDDDFGPALELLKMNFELLAAPIEFIIDTLGKVSDVGGDAITSLSEMEGILGEIARQILAVGRNIGLVTGNEPRVQQRGLAGVEQVQVAGTGGPAATKAAAEGREININRSASDLQRIAANPNVSPENRTKAQALAGVKALTEFTIVEAMEANILNLEGRFEAIKGKGGRGRGRTGKKKGKGKKEPAVTDAELLTLINEAAATGQSLTGLVGDRALPEGPPPVITIQTTTNKFDMGDLLIEVTGVPGTSAEEVAAQVALQVPAEIRLQVEEAIEMAQPSRKR